MGSEMQDMEQNTSQRSPAAGCTVEDLFLATATVQAEATGSQTPLIKEELRYTIQRKRRRRGQPDVTSYYKEPGPERLTPRDIARQESRRASNRKAANKCRQKKKAEEERRHEEMACMIAENARLVSENEALKKSVDGLTEMLQSKECITCALTKVADLLVTDDTQLSLQNAALIPQGD